MRRDAQHWARQIDLNTICRAEAVRGVVIAYEPGDVVPLGVKPGEARLPERRVGRARTWEAAEELYRECQRLSLASTQK